MQKLIFPLAVFLAALAVPAGVAVIGNGGHFVYTLDDPYIHLSLAENIARGHYGINPGEFTAPSSSVLWPFLLVPFSSTPFFSLVPLLLNTLFALFTVFLLRKFYGAGGLLFTLVSIFAFNTAGLVLTGMEHSLQLLLVVLTVVGISDYLETGRITPLFAFALMAAPLVRYECLAVSLPVLAFLFAAGERKKALLYFAVIVVFLGGFSLFLVHLGLSPLPASVIAKSVVAGNSGSAGSFAANIVSSVKSFRGAAQLLLLVPFVLVLFNGKRSRIEKLFAGSVALSVVLHLLVGRSGWFHRYGVYMWAFSVLAAFQLYRNFFNRHRVSVLFLLLLLSADYLSGYTKIPAASHNIFQQQYQMGRFVHRWLHEPVAVNDLGLVAMGYDHYVLDMWGLATPAALAGSSDPLWVDSAALVNGVNTAIVYRSEVTGLQHWTCVARMEISPPMVVCVDGGVDFLAAPWVSADSLAKRLEEFAETLPEGINLVIFE